MVTNCPPSCSREEWTTQQKQTFPPSTNPPWDSGLHRIEQKCLAFGRQRQFCWSSVKVLSSNDFSAELPLKQSPLSQVISPSPLHFQTLHILRNESGNASMWGLHHLVPSRNKRFIFPGNTLSSPEGKSWSLYQGKTRTGFTGTEVSWTQKSPVRIQVVSPYGKKNIFSTD